MPVSRSIDHVVIAVDDLDRAAADFAGLGFTLTPRAYHADNMGTSNRLAQLEARNFIELLEVDRPDTLDDHAFDADPPRFSFGAHNRAFVAKRGGMSMLVLTTDDARGDIEHFRKLGLQTYEPFHFERKGKLPDGTEVTLAFTLGFVTDPDLPDMGFFICQHHAPQYFWKPGFQTHENGARAIAAVHMTSPDPMRHADFLTKLTGGAQEEIDRGVCVTCGRQELLMVTPERIRELATDVHVADASPPSFAGIAVATSGPEPGITPPDLACGVFIEWRPI